MRGFVGVRLRMMRELRGMAQRELAQDLVSPAAISLYENGEATPSDDIAAELAARLGVTGAFLTAPTEQAELPAFFRSLKAAPASARKWARHHVQAVADIVQVLSREVRLPVLELAREPVQLDTGRETIEEIAAELRGLWGLPAGPVMSMVEVAERHGIVVAMLSGADARIDAFSVPFRRPVVVLTDTKGKRDRSRFDIAHEVGHLVMHGPGEAGVKTVESQAHQFAAGFLMPANEIKDDLTQVTELEDLIRLKRKWQVSLQALIYRMKTLEVIDQHEYVRIMKIFSARGWRRHEPGDLGGPEQPRMLTAAMELAGLTAEDLALRTRWPLPVIEDVVGGAASTRPALEL